eukprot:scaffold370044_cov40-Prasinocladus_malaysianus.AAC.1
MNTSTIPPNEKGVDEKKKHREMRHLVFELGATALLMTAAAEPCFTCMTDYKWPGRHAVHPVRYYYYGIGAQTWIEVESAVPSFQPLCQAHNILENTCGIPMQSDAEQMVQVVVNVLAAQNIDFMQC